MERLAAVRQVEARQAERPQLWLPVSIRAWRRPAVDLGHRVERPQLPRRPRFPRGSWSTHLMGKPHCPHLLPHRLLPLERRLVVRPAVLVAEAAAVVPAEVPHLEQLVVPRRCRSPESDRNSPGRP